MQTNTSPNIRRWERESATIPIKLVLKAESFKADNLATTGERGALLPDLMARERA
jgi:hypothetical protein